MLLSCHSYSFIFQFHLWVYHAVTVSLHIQLNITVIYHTSCTLGNYINEQDILPITISHSLLGNFNFQSDKPHTSCLLQLLSSFDLNQSPPTHREANILDMIFSQPENHSSPLLKNYFLSFKLSLLLMFKSPHHHPPALFLISCYDSLNFPSTP